MLTIASPTARSIQAKFFRGLADPSRLSILESLRAGPRTVGELVESTSLSQPNTSNHLACLFDCGLVTREQEGKFVRYSLADTRVALLLSTADELLSDIAEGLYTCTRYATPERAD